MEEKGLYVRMFACVRGMGESSFLLSFVFSAWVAEGLTMRMTILFIVKFFFTLLLLSNP